MNGAKLLCMVRILGDIPLMSWGIEKFMLSTKLPPDSHPFTKFTPGQLYVDLDYHATGTL
jgi:hypothetical protein